MTPYEAPTIGSLLAEQQTLTAVDRFAAWHADEPTPSVPAQARYYRDLIPLAAPGVGQQYAFDVDLEACSGCKACVSACHSLNGLAAEETWRNVGLLLGQNGSPRLQHVTTACHHCLEPGCLVGCPTNAYEKDPATGVVRHLDDQCFGCQYCTMMCPYEVPQYNAALGIVRKCDMCHGRLAAGEAPACVQACPNQAIRIALVDVAEVRPRGEAGAFLPTAPPPSWTLPTTLYRGADRLPDDVRPADQSDIRPYPAHGPLVVLLVLTQGALGGFAAALLGVVASGAAIALLTTASWLLGALGVVAATFHLGRPAYAFRGILGWRHSWMSREAIAFGIFLPAGGASAVLAVARWRGWALGGLAAPRIAQGATIAATLAAAAGVYCSIRIYQATQRDWWRGGRTAIKFWLTAALVGALTALTSQSAANFWNDDASHDASLFGLASVILATTLAKLFYERRLTAPDVADKRGLACSAKLLANDLRGWTALRTACGIAGAAATVPLAVVRLRGGTSLAIALAAAALLLAGEFVERTLYFRAAVPRKMPGGIAA